MLGEGDDGLLAEGEEDVVLRLGYSASKSVGRGALALPSEGGRADPLLTCRSLGLGGEEGRGESSVGLVPTEGGGVVRRIRGRHPELRNGGGGSRKGLLARSNSGPVGGVGRGHGRQLQ